MTAWLTGLYNCAVDPGNWATDLAAGSAYGYRLLIAILLANLLACFYQACALKLGVVAERDLAQCCRDAYPRWANVSLWVLSEVTRLQPVPLNPLLGR